MENVKSEISWEADMIQDYLSENKKINLDKTLLKEAIRASLDLQSTIISNQEYLREVCDPKTCQDSHFIRKWGIGVYVCNVCDRR